MTTKKLPIGIEDFKDIKQENFYYVDKTGFIKELLENWAKVNLFTRPRRFGKTLTMDMLKCFFEIGCDSSLFDELKISKETELCEEYMGKFPVISITLKGIDRMDYEKAVASLRGIIGNEASRFSFLLDSPHLNENEIAQYQALITVKDGEYSMSEEVLIDGLHLLSKLLEKHFHKKVIVLIDEYDVPLDKAYEHNYYDKMVLLIRNMFSNVLKSNNSLYFAVITGCLRISKESIFTGLNNINTMTITDKHFSEYFGFTEDEVNELLSYYNRLDALDIMRKWYDGYRFGDTFIYCPWDVIKYIQDLKIDAHAMPENYWVNTSGNDMIRRFIDKADKATRIEIEHLVAGESIQKVIKPELTYRELDANIDNLWSVLLTTGYLTPVQRISAKEYQLKIPNAEILDLFVTQIQEWFQDVSRSDTSRIETFCDAFPNEKSELIETMINDYLWDSISIRDTAIRKTMKENFYHGMLLGLLQSKSNWLTKFNAEMGEGYSDIVICTPERIGIIIELKYAEDGNLDQACTNALEQIEEKKYAATLKRMKMKKIITYGIAFYEKSCQVRKGTCG